nr:hypothetical protein [uncultured bacterium]
MQSPQTGYVHFDEASEERSDTIPLLENFCFVLALFRSRISESVLEGKMLLEKLLFFEVDGNFPLYLHEYPLCKDRDFSLQLLPVFHWLLTDFRSALGDPLALRLEMLIGRILSHSYKMHAQRPLSKSSEFRLKSYFQPQAVPLWIPSSPEEWAEALISLQIAPASLNGVGLLEQALELWHPQLCTYIGVQHYHRSEPKTTLFDLLMGHYYGRYSSRALKDIRVHLLSSMIQPFGRFSGQMQKELPCHVLTQDALKPYALYWGNEEKLHSFIIEPHGAHCKVVREPDQIMCTVTLPSNPPADNQDRIEFSFFTSLSSKQDILIQGTKATTFQCRDLIELCSTDLKLSIEIELVHGEGKFFGHLLRSNRPSQTGKNLKYETYDWQIALRTIRRSEECVLKAIIKNVPTK